MHKHIKAQLILAASLFATLLPATQADSITYIAGTTPSERPSNAPNLKVFEKNGNWYKQGLHGVVQPYPFSLHFLEDQGAWFSPFTTPGMTGPYDIRAWHTQ